MCAERQQRSLTPTSAVLGTQLEAAAVLVSSQLSSGMGEDTVISKMVLGDEGAKQRSVAPFIGCDSKVYSFLCTWPFIASVTLRASERRRVDE